MKLRQHPRVRRDLSLEGQARRRTLAKRDYMGRLLARAAKINAEKGPQFGQRSER